MPDQPNTGQPESEAESHDERQWTLNFENGHFFPLPRGEEKSRCILVVPEANLTTERQAREAAERERDENFGTIETICRMLYDPDCENGCDEGLEYEGVEWCPCPCVYLRTELQRPSRRRPNV